MNKKILIGSIIAVALLTLVSFSSAVGYSSVKSDSKIISPLFSVKNNRGEVSSNYLGKGKESTISFPNRDNKTSTVLKIMNIIIDMDEATFQRFFDRLEKSNQVEDDDFQKIKEISIQMRKTSNTRLSSNEYTEIIPFDTKDEYPSFIYMLFNFFVFLFMIYLIIFTGWTVACPL